MLAVWCGTAKVFCEDCENRPDIKESRGCNGFPDGARDLKELNIKIKGCPRKEITIETMFWIEAFEWLQKGLLPWPGTWLDQSMSTVEACKVVAGEITKYEMQEQEKLKKQAEKARHGKHRP